jgi:hypothetical protein
MGLWEALNEALEMAYNHSWKSFLLDTAKII